MNDLCAPVSIMQFRPLGLMVWKLTDVKPGLLGLLLGRPHREGEVDLSVLDPDPPWFLL